MRLFVFSLFHVCACVAWWRGEGSGRKEERIKGKRDLFDGSQALVHALDAPHVLAGVGNATHKELFVAHQDPGNLDATPEPAQETHK